MVVAIYVLVLIGSEMPCPVSGGNVNPPPVSVGSVTGPPTSGIRANACDLITRSGAINVAVANPATTGTLVAIPPSVGAGRIAIASPGTTCSVSE
jgi:hypothetical protein